MAEKVEIEAVINLEGEVELTIKGLRGDGCEDIARALEDALGEVVERKKTPEYYQAQAQQRGQRHQGRGGS